jgi:ribose-phosphate pyrophosphokinase
MGKSNRPTKNPTLYGELKIFSGRANIPLAESVCKHLGIKLGKSRIDVFPDGELLTKIEEDVRGKDVFVIQPTSPPVNDNLMELLLFLDSFRRASARRITAVLPYYGYARQDRKDVGRVPISAKLVANQLVAAGANRILVMELHAHQIQGFFDIPVDHLLATPVFIKYFAKLKKDGLVLVSPDVGNMKVAGVYADKLGGELAVVAKRRISASEAKAENIIGNVKDKTVLMFDDMISTAGTICGAAKLAKDKGAKKIYIAAVHGLFRGPALERIDDSPIDEVVVTDTVPVNEEVKKFPRIKVLSVSELLGNAICRIHSDKSISELFNRAKTRKKPPIS